MRRIVTYRPKPRPKPKSPTAPTLTSRVVRYDPPRRRPWIELPDPPEGNPAWDELMRRVREDGG